MSGNRVAFVASSDTHVDMFSPVMAELDRRGVRVALGILDSLYGQGAAGRARTARLPVTEIAPAVAVRSAFYRRNPLLVWRDVLQCRGPVSQWLRETAPTIVVIGNDRGLIEKLILQTAHRHGMAVILVQDGTLATHGPRDRNPREHLRQLAKVTGSRALIALGLRYLAASQYGQGGADLLCASGSDGAWTLRKLGAPRDRIVVTGQPRFDVLRGHSAAANAGSRLVVVFTTPFGAAGIGADLQDRQDRLVAELAREFAASEVPFRVKPHPREGIDEYRRMVDDATFVQLGRPADVLGDCGVAIIGTSTVIEEAGIVGVPVIVPGHVLHAGQFDHRLPPADIYPRFETAREGVALARQLLEDMRTRQDVLRRQQAAVAERVHVDPSHPAALLVADAICRLMQ